MNYSASQQLELEGIVTRCGESRREIAVSRTFDAESAGMISRWTAKLEGALVQRKNDDKALPCNNMRTTDASLASLTIETQEQLTQMEMLHSTDRHLGDGR